MRRVRFTPCGMDSFFKQYITAEGAGTEKSIQVNCISIDEDDIKWITRGVIPEVKVPLAFCRSIKMGHVCNKTLQHEGYHGDGNVLW